MRLRSTAGSAVLALILLTACGNEPPEPDGGGLSGGITVLADDTLEALFAELERDFEAANPDAAVELEFLPTSEIGEVAGRRGGGGEPDVFASTGEMDRPLRAKVDRASVFARSPLAIYVAAGNPKGITGLQDLTRPDVSVALCDDSTPCGPAGVDAVTSAGVAPVNPTNHAGGAAALKQVTDGKADAALVLQTDVPRRDGSVERVDLADHAVTVSYSLARFRSSDNEAVARGFVSFVLSGEAQQTLRSFGFSPPS